VCHATTTTYQSTAVHNLRRPSTLSEDEIVGLRRSADTVKGVIKSLGL
jgi:hypothetical protein